MSKTKKPRYERLFKWLVPLLIGIVVPVIALEIFLRVYYDNLPISFLKYLPTDVRILAQSSKTERVPENYIALLGDSYALGWGDWSMSVLESQPFDDPSYHSAHVIHDITGTDVLSFAQPGFGSFDGLAYYPPRYFEMLRKRGFALRAPSRIMVYFYEGNDFSDNVALLERYWDQKPDFITKQDLHLLFQEIFEKGSLNQRGPIGRIRHSEIANASYALKFFYTLTKDTYTMLRQTLGLEEPKEERVEIPEEQQLTKIRVKGQELKVPVPLQGPALELDEDEIEESLLVFELSLEYLLKYFGNSDIIVVYLPSPLSSYELTSDAAHVYTKNGKPPVYLTEAIPHKSDMLCNRVLLVARKAGAAFFDTRPIILPAARQDVLHGPRDWQHFNRVGYGALGNAVATYLSERDLNIGEEPPGCSSASQ